MDEKLGECCATDKYFNQYSARELYIVVTAILLSTGRVLLKLSLKLSVSPAELMLTL